MEKTNEHNVKLSILMMTFNQGEFIKEAIDSVLKQNLPFQWELLIGDDASIDNTEKVVVPFVESNKNIFYYKNQENIGLHKNYASLVQKANGEYIALLEADDYWVDIQKCSLQIELLDKNPKMAWTFTNSITINVDKIRISETKFTLPISFDSNYFVENFFNTPSNSIIFRKEAEPEKYPSFFFNLIQWDTALLYLRLFDHNQYFNKIGFVNCVGLAWRRHPKANSTSIFSGEKRYKDWIVLNHEIKKRAPKELKTHFNKDYVAYENLAIINFKKKSFLKTIQYLIKSFVDKPIRPIKEYKDMYWKMKNN